MHSMEYHSYEEATHEYLMRFQALRDEPPTTQEAATRGADDIPVERLIERADEIADVSASMVSLARNYLEAPDPTLREGISGHLLAQAAAELQVATELMRIAADETAGPDALGTPHEVTRGTRKTHLRDAIDGMEKVMIVPVSDGLLTPSMARRSVKTADTPEQAKINLKEATHITVGAISQRVIEIGGDLTFNLVFNTEWSAVIQSAGLMSQDIAKLLDRLKEGVGDITRRALTTATKTILNVFDKILALLGRDIEDQTRKQIQKWLEDVKKAGKIELFEQFIGKLYEADKLEEDLPVWLEKTMIGIDEINTTTSHVSAISDKFTILVERINSVGDVVGLAKFIQAQFPQVLVVITAIRLALLTVLVYGGYDYIGYGQGSFLNLTKGVTEVIRENLAI